MSEEFMVSFLMEASGKDTEVAWSFNAVSGSGMPRCQSWCHKPHGVGQAS